MHKAHKRNEINSRTAPMTLVKFDLHRLNTEYQAHYRKAFKEGSFPFKQGDIVLFMGEIKQMPGHGVFVIQNKNGPASVYYGYHMNNFVVPTEDEI